MPSGKVTRRTFFGSFSGSIRTAATTGIPDSTRHTAEMPADGETKTGAAVFARCSRGGLGELLEQFAHLLRRHADARIGHRERDPVATALLPLASGDGDSAFLGELVGVTRQVEQGLPEAGLVSVHRIEVRWA